MRKGDNIRLGLMRRRCGSHIYLDGNWVDEDFVHRYRYYMEAADSGGAVSTRWMQRVIERIQTGCPQAVISTPEVGVVEHRGWKYATLTIRFAVPKKPAKRKS